MTGRTFNNPMSASLDTFVTQGMQRRMMYRSMLRSKGYSDNEISQITKLPEVVWAKYMAKKQPITDTPESVAAKQKKANTTSAKPVAKPANPVPATRFTPTGKRLLLDQAAEAFGTNNEEKAAYKTIFAEVAKAYESEAKRLGFANDIAGAMAFLIDTAYTLYKPDVKPNGDVGNKAIVRQLQEALDNDTLRKSPAAEKQKLYEYYISLGAYLYAMSEIAKESKDETAKAGAVKLGGEALKSLLKVEPSRVRLTENGLEIAPE